MVKKFLIAVFLVAFNGHQNVQGQTSVDIDLGTGKGQNPSVSASIDHKADGWSAGGTGTLDTKGNWGVAGGLNRHGDGWSAGVTGALDSNDNWSAGIGASRQGDGWSAGVTGALDSNDNWSAGIGASRQGDGWSAGVTGALDSNDNWSAGIGASRQGDGWSAGIRGTTDSRGNFGIGAGFSLRFRKRSIHFNGKHYTVTLHVDPCEFNMYDINGDGVIVKTELHAIFGDNMEADELFNALDITTGDGHIEEEEFYLMSHVFINGCETENVEHKVSAPHFEEKTLSSKQF